MTRFWAAICLTFILAFGKRIQKRVLLPISVMEYDLICHGPLTHKCELQKLFCCIFKEKSLHAFCINEYGCTFTHACFEATRRDQIQYLNRNIKCCIRRQSYICYWDTCLMSSSDILKHQLDLDMNIILAPV